MSSAESLGETGPSTDQSDALYRRALEIIPGATQLISRRPHIFAPGVAPIYAAHGKDARIWDVDGNEFIDYGMAVSSCILGYADSHVNAAVRAQLDDGVQFSLNNPLEIELAERLCETIPCAEMVRYAKGGGEACALAVRICRGATGRRHVLFCGYHGWHDWYLAANLEAEQALDTHLIPGIEPRGVPAQLAGTATPFEYGDLAALEQLIELHTGDVACVIMEPLRSELPPEDYLEAVRQLTRDAGIPLVFDEVTTGFRHAIGGVEQLLDVVPDVAVLAKSLGNGYAMGAVVGRRDVMQHAAELFISSTNWSELIGIRAALVTLEEIRRRDVPRLLEEFGVRLIEGLRDAFAEANVRARMIGLPATPRIEFLREDGIAPWPQAASLFFQEMARRGVLINAAPRHSAAHGEQELQETLRVAREALAIVGRAIESDRVEATLEGGPRGDPFRRLVN